MSLLKTSVAAVAALSAAAPGGAVQAQSAGSAVSRAQGQSADLFARDRNVSVRERPRPDYEALGVPFGVFSAFPRVEIEADQNDNIFAVATGQDSDLIWRVKPELALESGWSRHSLRAYARAAFSRYSDFSDENSEDWGAGAAGRIDITRAANLALGADYARLTEPRTSSSAPAAAAEPVRYDLAQAFAAGTRVSGRMKLGVRADLRAFDYDDAFTAGGVELDQDSRDRTISSLSGRGDYALSPATAVFGQLTANTRDYDDTGAPGVLSRDSDGYEALAGVNFEISAVSRGEIAAGYVSQDFDNYDSIDGFAARGLLEWFPTQMTTVTLTGARAVEDSGIAFSGGYMSSSAGVRVDHELRRNVILSANATVARDEYEGIDREDERVGVSVSGTWLVNRRAGVTVAASKFEQSSKGADSGADFDVNRLTVTLVTQF